MAKRHGMAAAAAAASRNIKRSGMYGSINIRRQSKAYALNVYRGAAIMARISKLRGVISAQQQSRAASATRIWLATYRGSDKPASRQTWQAALAS